MHFTTAIRILLLTKKMVIMNSNFAILFYPRTSKRDQNGLAPIYMRITVGGKRVEISTQRKIDPDKWNPVKNRASGTTLDIKRLNSYLDSALSKVYEKHQELLMRNLPVTALTLKNAYTSV